MSINTSFYAIPVAWVVAILPRGYAVATFSKHSKSKSGPEVLNPRAFHVQVASDQSLSPIVRSRIVRAESAQLNGFENLGFFSAAIVAGNAAELDKSLLNGVAWGYVASRIVYNYVFIKNDLYSPFLRTAIFMVGIALICVLFCLAGLRLQRL